MRGTRTLKLVQIDTWTGENLAFHDNLYIAGNSIRPFDVLNTTRTNLQMFDNVYVFAEEPLAFFWDVDGNEQVYTSIDEWRTDTGLDWDSQFFIGPFRRAALDALRRAPTLRPEMFHKLHRLTNERE